MTALLDWLAGPSAESLCLTLLHSLWQGALWCALLLLILRRIPSDRPDSRYAIALACMYGLLGGACLTWSILRQPAGLGDVQAASVASISTGKSDVIDPTPPASSVNPTLPASGRDTSPASSPALGISHFTPWVVTAWLLGASVCLFLSSRHVAAVRRFRLDVPIEAPEPLRLLAKLVSSMKISSPVQLLSVAELAGPCHFRSPCFPRIPEEPHERVILLFRTAIIRGPRKAETNAHLTPKRGVPTHVSSGPGSIGKVERY